MNFKLGSMVFITLFLSAAHSQATDTTSNQPENIIFQIYEEHQPMNGKNISFADKKTLRRYFTEELTALFLRDDECIIRTHEVCNLDFDPIYDAQDYEDNSPIKLDVKKISTKPHLCYQVMFTNIDRITLIYELQVTKSGWRISDIIYSSNNSLKALLSQPQ